MNKLNFDYIDSCEKKMPKFLVFAKPDAVKRGLVGEVISRFERHGFVLHNLRYTTPTIQQASEHYAEHKEKDIFANLIAFTISGPIVLMVWSGDIPTARKLVGATHPLNADAGTIRGDFANTIPANLVHCSDSPESASREIELWFSDTDSKTRRASSECPPRPSRHRRTPSLCGGNVDIVLNEVQ